MQGRRKKITKISLEHADWECKNSYSKTCRKNMLKIRRLCSTTVFAFFFFAEIIRMKVYFVVFLVNFISSCVLGETVFLFDFIRRRNVKLLSYKASQKNASSCTPAIVCHNFKSWCLFSDNKNPTTFFLSLSVSRFVHTPSHAFRNVVEILTM